MKEKEAFVQIDENILDVFLSTFLFFLIVFIIGSIKTDFKQINYIHYCIAAVSFLIVILFRIRIPLLMLSNEFISLRILEYGIPLGLKVRTEEMAVIEITEEFIEIQIKNVFTKSFKIKKSKWPVKYQKLLQFILLNYQKLICTEIATRNIRNLTKAST